MFHLADIVRRHALIRPDAGAIRYRSSSTSYGELERETYRLAHALIDAGVGPAEHVAVLGKNSPEYLVAYFACAAAGAILTILEDARQDRRDDPGRLAVDR